MTYGYDVENISYRPIGGASRMSTGGGGTVGATFDDAGRMVISNPGAVHERTFTYDNNGNLTSISAPSTPDFSRSYVYDPLNRLTHAEGPWGDIDYTYDDVGNRLTKTEDSQTDTYAYVTGTNRLDTVTGTTAYSHDTNGNITGINNKVLTYNQDNRLVRVEENSNILGEYTYNGLGQRIIKTAGGITTVFHYDFDGNIIGESQLNGNFTKEYIYYGSSKLAMADVATEDVYFYGNDRLGTPQALTDSTNKVVWEANYKPFGEVEVNPNSSVENNFRLPGQYYDSETGFHYNYHRYYDPKTGMYSTPDPIGQWGGINLYLYSENNPINFTDPLGLNSFGWGEQNRLVTDIELFLLWLTPRYGRYDGPGYSGPGVPIDSMDECFKEHDDCYRYFNVKAWGNKNQCEMDDKKKCDDDLFQCLSRLPLSPSLWNRRPPWWMPHDYTNKYRFLAQTYFYWISR